MIAANGPAPNGAADDFRRESWRQVMSMRRSTRRFRARVAQALPSVQMAMEADPQLGDVAAAMAVMARILDSAVRDLDRLRLPEELFEVVVS